MYDIIIAQSKGGITMDKLIIALLVSIGRGIFWGWVTHSVIRSKGYYTNWFWWGFFFGLFAFVAACAKPQNIWWNKPNYSSAGNAASPSSPVNGGWLCSCGRENAPYVSSCVCGISKSSYLTSKHDSLAKPEN